jgi:GNAT superfamily N-acetyltransferase
VAHIRPAAPADLKTIAAVHVQADSETYRPIFGDRFRLRPLAESRARWREALGAGDVLLVAEHDASIVGLAHAHGAWMSALYLLAAHRRQGFGEALLAELCRQVLARGVDAIEFQCVAANVKAIAFYEAMGARQVGRKTEGAGDDAWEDVVFRLEAKRLAAFRAP